MDGLISSDSVFMIEWCEYCEYVGNRYQSMYLYQAMACIYRVLLSVKGSE